MITYIERIWFSVYISLWVPTHNYSSLGSQVIKERGFICAKLLLTTNITDRTRSILTYSTDLQSLQIQVTFLWSGSVLLTCIIVKTYLHPRICKIQSWYADYKSPVRLCSVKNALHRHKSSAGKIFCLTNISCSLPGSLSIQDSGLMNSHLVRQIRL